MVLAAAVSTLLAVLYVPFRDMAPIWEVATQLLFWGTPIIYVIETAPESVRELLMLNPLAVIIEQARHAVIDPSAPTRRRGRRRLGTAPDPARDHRRAVIVASLVLYRRAASTLAERL